MKRGSLPNAEQLARLAVSINPALAEKEPDTALKAALRLWLHAHELTAKASAAGDVDVWLVADEPEKHHEIWKQSPQTLEAKKALRARLSQIPLFWQRRDDSKTLIVGIDGPGSAFEWLQKNGKSSDQFKTQSGLMDALNQSGRLGAKYVAGDTVTVGEMRAFLVWRTQQRTDQKQAQRKRRSQSKSGAVK